MGLNLVCALSLEDLCQLYEHLDPFHASNLSLDYLDYLNSLDKVNVNYQGMVGKSDGSPISVFETTCPEHNQTMMCRLEQNSTGNYSCLFRDLDNENRLETNQSAIANDNLFFQPETFDESQLAVVVSVPGNECVINTIENLQSTVLRSLPPRSSN